MYQQTSSLSETQTKTLSLFEHLQSDVEFTYQKMAMNDLKTNRIETYSIHRHFTANKKQACLNRHTCFSS